MKKLILLASTIALAILFVGCTEKPQAVQPPNKKVQSLSIYANLNAIDFIDANTGIAVGDSGTIIKTTDGGDNWSLLNSGFNDRPLLCVKMLNSDTILCGGHGVLVRSINGGTSWDITYLDYGKWAQTINFFSKNNCYAMGKGNEIPATIYRTTDCGYSWSFIDSTIGIWGDINSLITFDSLTGLVVNTSNDPMPFAIYKTTDGGNSFYVDTTLYPNPGFVFSLNNPDISAVFGVGWKGVIWYSNNKGNTWSIVREWCDTCNTLLSVNARTSQLIFACGSKGFMLNSTNGGQSWNSVNSGTTRWLNAISYPSSSYVIAVGDSGTIVKINL